MIGLPRRRWPGRPAVQTGTPGAAGPVEGLRRWRRHLTVDNAFFVAMVLVLAFVLARRQGFFLASPSVEMRAPAERGSVAPDFALPGLNGAPIRLSDQQGKVILLNIWATWCPPCRAEMPSMEKLYQAYRDRGLVILAVSEDRTGPETVASFVRELALTFPILLDPAGELVGQYGVRGLPTSYLLDRRGRVVSAEVGARDWSGKAVRQVVETLLSEG